VAVYIPVMASWAKPECGSESERKGPTLVAPLNVANFRLSDPALPRVEAPERRVKKIDRPAKERSGSGTSMLGRVRAMISACATRGEDASAGNDAKA